MLAVGHIEQIPVNSHLLIGRNEIHEQPFYFVASNPIFLGQLFRISPNDALLLATIVLNFKS